MSDKVTGYCNALELQCCQSGIVLSIDQRDFIQTHQIVSCTDPAKAASVAPKSSQQNPSRP